ncbi:hypothetical protein V8C86DRAFT_2521607 [Haematococcus lacustris]|nr:hypothetical protein QJQ45_018516 [Haematococcus lacustris]
MSSTAKSATKPADLVNPVNLRHNLGVLGFFRTFTAVIAGIVVGIIGVEGWIGFVPHFLAQLLCAPAMLGKGAASPVKYFHTWFTLLFFNVFSSTTLLTYILFWMVFYNLCHIF